MNTTPPTWGTTARLALWGVLAVLAALVLLLAVVLDLARGIEQDAASRIEALRTLTILGPAALGAIGAVAGIGSGMHGARHVGGPPAPTSGELRSLAAGPLAEGGQAGEV